VPNLENACSFHTFTPQCLKITGKSRNNNNNNNNNNKFLYVSSQRYNRKLYCRQNKKAIKSPMERKTRQQSIRQNTMKKNSVKVKVDINKDRKKFT